MAEMKRRYPGRGVQSASRKTFLAISAVAIFTSLPLAAAEQVLAIEAPVVMDRAKVRLSWGHQSASARPFRIGFGTNHVVVTQITSDGFESGDVQQGGVCQTHAGAGDVDAVTAEVSWQRPTQPLRELGPMWDYLFEHSTPEAVARLKDDPGRMPDAPLLTVQLAEDGTRGFSIGLEQLLRHKAMWLPEQDVFRNPHRRAGRFRGTYRCTQRRARARPCETRARSEAGGLHLALGGHGRRERLSLAMGTGVAR